MSTAATTTAPSATPTPRPIALPPHFDGIPTQLQALPIWVCWRYEWDGKNKWKKPPYIAMTGSKSPRARSNDARTWRSFAQAKAAYLARPDFFDGVGIMADGDLVLGDFDHCLQDGTLSDFAHTYMPPTYAERSVGGDGAHFIALGTIDRARKKQRGELYAKGSPRFLTMTGRRLDGQPATLERCQDAIDRFAAALDQEPGATRARGSGTPRPSQREKSRKQLAADLFPETLRNEARQIYRLEIENLERRFKAGAWKEETQWWFVARRDYAGFHAKYPFVGLYDAAGAFDPSQARMATGRAIRGLGFTPAQYAALMTRYFASDRAELVARWGNKDTWWQELADIWNKSTPAKRGYWHPTAPKPKAADVIKYPRGRAGKHADLVEQVYTLLQDHRAGAQAVVKIGDLASAIGVHRRTISSILGELHTAGRIEEPQRCGQYGGLIIAFSDVIYSEMPAAVYSAPAPEIAPAAAPIEDTHTHTVFLPDPPAADHISAAPQPPALAELATYYLDQPARETGERLVSEKTGEIRYRRTAKHFAACVTAEYPAYTTDAAIAAYVAEQERRKQVAAEEWQRFFARLRAMTNDELIAYVGGRCRTEVHELARDGATFDKHLYRTRLKCAKNHLSWRGLRMPARKTLLAQIAQADAEAARLAREQATPKKMRLIACQPIRYDYSAPPAPPEPAPPEWRAVYDRLVARNAAQKGINP